jgi:hypothetical protein
MNRHANQALHRTAISLRSATRLNPTVRSIISNANSQIISSTIGAALVNERDD